MAPSTKWNQKLKMIKIVCGISQDEKKITTFECTFMIAFSHCKSILNHKIKGMKWTDPHKTTEAMPNHYCVQKYAFTWAGRFTTRASCEKTDIQYDIINSIYEVCPPPPLFNIHDAITEVKNLTFSQEYVSTFVGRSA